MITLTKQDIYSNDKFSQERINHARLIRAVNDNDITLLLGSETGNYIIAQWNSAPILWVWTSNDITEKEKHEIIDFINENNEVNRIILKKDIFDFLKPEMIKNKTILNTQINPHPLLKKEQKGELSKATMDELQIVALFLAQHIEETDNETHTLEELLQRAKELIENGNFYIWRDEGGQMASFARLNFDDDTIGRIDIVFTDRNKRCQGFAGMLVFTLSKMLIESGRMPMLYTDSEYIASNKCYQNVGFVVQDQLIGVNLNK